MEIRKTTSEIIQQADAFFVEQGKGKPITAALLIKCLEICEDKFAPQTEKQAEMLIYELADKFNFRIEMF